jgi:ATPase family protein associated with various cellular activities (AAA)
MNAPLALPVVANDEPFAEASHTPAQHFRLALFGVIGRVLEACGRGDVAAALQAHPFLSEYVDEVAPHFGLEEWLGERWSEALARWEERSPRRLPILSLMRAGVSRLQIELLLAAGLVDEDSRFGEIFEAARGRDRRPSWGTLAAWWRCEPGGADRIDGVQRELHELVRAGLLQVTNPDAPRSDWTLAVPGSVWDAIAGEAPRLPWLSIVPLESLPSFDGYIAPRAVAERCVALPGLVRARPEAVVVVRGPRHNGRKTLLGCVARELGKPLAVAKEAVLEDEARWRLFGALCTLMDALPVVDCGLAPGEDRTLPPLSLACGPLCVATSRHGAWSTSDARPVVALDLPMPAEEDRARHWRALLPPPADGDAAALAACARLASGHIRHAAASASAFAALESRAAIGVADLQRACRELRSARLETLATRLPAEGGLERLAVDDATREELAVLLSRCAMRERLATCGAGGAPSGVGVRALLAGPSGTGKTWAARLLAASLGKDLYRLEQSATVSKWLGDTEKALYQAFSAAEELDVVLLVDEGDSMMGTRTSIASSNDRHANFQTNTLLQLFESYEGILFVTTNAADCIDRAFARRMDAVVSFRAPDEWRRYEILRLHLGEESLDEQWLQEVACRCVLNGGQLRNVVSHARLLALQEGGGLRAGHLHSALVREYRKIGATCPVRG